MDYWKEDQIPSLGALRRLRYFIGLWVRTGVHALKQKSMQRSRGCKAEDVVNTVILTVLQTAL
jgi:hypothetical protein